VSRGRACTGHLFLSDHVSWPPPNSASPLPHLQSRPLHSLPPVAGAAAHPAPDCPAGYREQHPPGPIQMGGRAHACLVRPVPAIGHSLRAEGRSPPCPSGPGRSPHHVALRSEVVLFGVVNSGDLLERGRYLQSEDVERIAQIEQARRGKQRARHFYSRAARFVPRPSSLTNSSEEITGAKKLLIRSMAATSCSGFWQPQASPITMGR
jgi:hypothetical protein